MRHSLLGQGFKFNEIYKVLQMNNATTTSEYLNRQEVEHNG